MKIETTYSAVLMMSVVALLVTSMPVYASEMDDRIELSARKSHVFRSYLGGDDIKIQSKDGAVTLTGTVSAESQKALAEDTVAGLPGVKAWTTIESSKVRAPRKTRMRGSVTKVKTTLLFHRNVNTGETESCRQRRHVTLRGEAATQARKDLTTEYAKEVEGVKDVSNEMTVSKPQMPSGPPISTKTTVGEDIDDASTTAQVKISLLYHRSTSALNTKVETNKGVVTLYGKAKNAAEKDLATKLA